MIYANCVTHVTFSFIANNKIRKGFLTNDLILVDAVDVIDYCNSNSKYFLRNYTKYIIIENMTLKLYDSVTNQFHLKPESINLNNLNFFHEEEELTGLIETNSINFKGGTVVNSKSIDIDLQNIEAVKTKINSAYYYLIIGLPAGLSFLFLV